MTQTTSSEIEIQCFGVLQQVCGGASHHLAIESTPITVATILERFVREHPALQAHLGYTACAVGDRVVDRRATLQAGDTLVLLPPVSGG